MKANKQRWPDLPGRRTALCSLLALSLGPAAAATYRQELATFGNAVGETASANYRQQVLLGGLAVGDSSGGTFRLAGNWWAAQAAEVSDGGGNTGGNSGGNSGSNSGSGGEYNGGNTPVVVPDNATVTLTGTAPVQASAGSTLVLDNPAASSGTRITLPAIDSSGNAGSVTLRFGTQQLHLTPQSGSTVVTVQTVQQGGSTVPVLALSSGTVLLRASNAGQSLLQLGGGLLVQAGQAGTEVQITANGQLSVSSGVVRLQRNALAAGSELATAQVFAGELADIDASGQLLSQRLGSPQGKAQGVGDPLGQTPAWLGSVPRLSGKVARLGEADLLTSLSADLHGVIGQSGTDPLSQSAQGVVRVGKAGESQLLLRPVGDIRIEEGRADGITALADGRAESSRQGVVVSWVPTVSDPAAFAAYLARLDSGITLQPAAAGAWRTVAGARQFVYQPAWLDHATSGAAGGLAVSTGDTLTWTDSRQQALYPALADSTTLLDTLRTADPAASLRSDGAGGIDVTLAGQAYRLQPRAELLRTPAGRSGQRWWQDESGRLYLNYPDGWSQELGVHAGVQAAVQAGGVKEQAQP